MKKKRTIVKILLALAVVLLAASSMSWGGRGRDRAAGTPAGTPALPVSAAAGETPAPKQSESTHVHSWESVMGTVHRDAVVEDVWVVDSEARTEPKDPSRTDLACKCGFTGTYETLRSHILDYREAWEADKTAQTESALQQHGYDTSNLDDWIIHESQGHWESRTVQEAYDGPGVVGLKCSVCGAEK